MTCQCIVLGGKTKGLKNDKISKVPFKFLKVYFLKIIQMCTVICDNSSVTETFFSKIQYFRELNLECHRVSLASIHILKTYEPQNLSHKPWFFQHRSALILGDSVAQWSASRLAA